MAVAEIDVPAAPAPAPTWWSHHSACAWVAAWLTVRQREMRAPRELVTDKAWRGELVSVAGSRRTVHTPDLVGIVPNRRPAAIEVELSRKSKARLRAILALHASWIAAGRSGACVYICGNHDVRDLVIAQAARVGLGTANGSLRVELLETVKALALEGRDGVPRGTGLAELTG
ncbi:MAG: hypothetical protein WAU75_20655 [Solirubrobacteraceae bacterium]